MTTTTLIYCLPPIISTLISSVLLVVLLIHRPGKSWWLAAIICLCAATWSSSQCLWVLADNIGEAIRANQIQYLAISLLPATWLVLGLNESGRQSRLRIIAPGLLIVPAVTLYYAFTYQDGHSNLLWENIAFIAKDSLPKTYYGPWFWIMALYSYLLIGGGCLILFSHFSQSPRYRSQLILTSLFPLFVVLLNYLHISGNWPMPLDPTPIGFSLSFSIWGWFMYRRRLFEISPAARNIALDKISDSIFILDNAGQIIDYNAAGADLLTLNKKLLGKPLRELIPQLPDLATLCNTKIINIGPGHYVEAKCSPINPGQQQKSELIVTLRDVSLQKKTYSMLNNARKALEKANTELNRLAHTDELTGLANRRFLLGRLDEEISRARRLQMDLGVIFIDLDHFKDVNDIYGHSVGDNVLKTVGQELLNHRKGIDIAARYGGEELVLVITNTDRAGVIHVAERLWRQLQDTDHTAPTGQHFRVTASLGVTLLEPEDLSGYDLIDRADSVLYHAKAMGRNRVCIASRDGFATLFDE